MTINLYPAPEVLKVYVEYFWAVNHHREETTEVEITSFVNGASGIIFQHHDGNFVFVSSAPFSGHEFQTGTLPSAYAYGQITRPNLILAKGSFSATGVIVEPHVWHALFGLSPIELTEQRIELNLRAQNSHGHMSTPTLTTYLLIGNSGSDGRYTLIEGIRKRTYPTQSFIVSSPEKAPKWHHSLFKNWHLLKRQCPHIFVVGILSYTGDPL